MFTNALYYPYILIPDNLWLRRAILYWDSISPIVPEVVEREIPRNHVSRELQSSGMLSFINPESILKWEEGRELSESFLEIVSSREFLAKVGKPNERKYTVKIHSHKFTNALLGPLRELRLYEFTTGGDWLNVERYTGILFMGYLASSLAKHEHLEPVTDNAIYHNSFLQSQIVPSQGHRETFLSFVLDGILPTPREEVPIRRILKFKEKHERELLAFRGEVIRIINHLNSVKPKDASELKREISSFKGNVEAQILDLEAHLKENMIKTILASLDVCCDVLIPELAVILGVGTISIPVAALLGADAAIKVGKEVFKGIVRRNSYLAENPYSYVFNVRIRLT